MSWPSDDGSADLRLLLEAARTGRALQPPLTCRDALAFLAGALAVQPNLPEAEAANFLLHVGAGPRLWGQARRLLEGAATAPAPARRFRLCGGDPVSRRRYFFQGEPVKEGL